MADRPYQQTTAPLEGKTTRFGHLGVLGFGFKLSEVLSSFVAFVLEEIVTTCNACSKLYFFEFVSCTAFLFTLLLLILLASSLHKKVGIAHWDLLDLIYTTVITFLFLIASAVFLSDNSGTQVEHVAGVFGIIASVVFLVNAAYLLVTKRSAMCGNPTNAPTTVQPQAQPSSPESEKLTNGQETA